MPGYGMEEIAPYKKKEKSNFQENSVKHKTAGWAYRFAAMIGLTISILSQFSPTLAQTSTAEALCGNGSPPDYGFSYPLRQPHWTVGWQPYASAQTVDKVDQIFDRLDEDAIAQTMILILPQEQVGIRPNCAVHFLRYMKLGLPSGERKDNGFVFLIVVEPTGIDVHYAVGLGLPALTAPELTNINRAAEASYQSTHSMDQALLTLANEFNTVARNNYEPAPSAVQTTPDAPNQQPAGAVSIPLLCGQVCLGLLLFFLFIWITSQMRGGGGFYGPGSGSWGGGSWGGGSSWGGGFGGFGSRGGPGNSSPRMRGGSGSGRSGRTK